MITERLTIKISVNKLSSYASIEQCLVSNLERLTSSKGRNGARDLISGCGFRSKIFTRFARNLALFFNNPGYAPVVYG